MQLPTKIPALWGQTFGGEKRDENGLVGVVGVARVSGQAAASGELDLTSERLGTFILIVASLNIFVGLFNLLPILPLDGGHMAVAIADEIRALLCATAQKASTYRLSMCKCSHQLRQRCIRGLGSADCSALDRRYLQSNFAQLLNRLSADKSPIA